LPPRSRFSSLERGGPPLQHRQPPFGPAELAVECEEVQQGLLRLRCKRRVLRPQPVGVALRGAGIVGARNAN
jgi:hypothetical protein